METVSASEYDSRYECYITVDSTCVMVPVSLVTEAAGSCTV